MQFGSSCCSFVPGRCMRARIATHWYRCCAMSGNATHWRRQHGYRNAIDRVIEPCLSAFPTTNPVCPGVPNQECDSYRGISMISAAAKIFAVLLNRFSVIWDSQIRPNQGNFHPKRGSVDQLFILRQILEHRFKYQQPTVACLIDFQTAFDSINQNALWKVMLCDGAPEELIKLIKSFDLCSRICYLIL